MLTEPRDLHKKHILLEPKSDWPSFLTIIYPWSWWQTEETKSSDKFGAYGILTAICISIVVGWGYILALAYTVMDPSALLDPANDAGGYAVAQLFYTIFLDRFGSGTGGIVCLGINAVAIYLGALACVTSNSRSVISFPHVWGCNLPELSI